MTLEHLTTVTAAESVLDDDGEVWTIRLVDPRRTAYGIQSVHEVDPRRVPMHVLEAVMVWAHAGLNPEVDDATDPPADPVADDQGITYIETTALPPNGMMLAFNSEQFAQGFYCVACGHDAHAPGQCNTLVKVTTDTGASTDACRCSVMQEAPRP